MRYALCSVCFFYLFLTSCQTVKFRTTAIILPAELKEAENQFSGLYIKDDRLYLLPECRLQENQEARLYSVSLPSLDSSLQDSTQIPGFRKHVIIGLNLVRDKITATGQVYEGLEAVVIQGSTVFLSIETSTPSPYCYLAKGHFINNQILLDTNQLQAIRKPRRANGESIYNAGFEAMTLHNGKLLAFYEYNYFEGGNYIYTVDTTFNTSIDSVETSPVPFRITDIVPGKKNHYTAVNFFFKGAGKDTVYRIPKTDPQWKNIYDTQGNIRNFERLIDIHFTGGKYKWKPIWQLPEPYGSYNLEGIASYKGGYFLINDKYMPTKPYYSALIYVR